LRPQFGEVSLEIVDNVTAALSNLSEFGFEVSPATDITIDGFAGKQLTLQAPPNETPGCDGWRTWRTTTRQNGVGPGEVNEVRVLDVDGVRLVISAAHRGDVPPEYRAHVESVLESVQISK
jgi:hypothetical protein